MSTHASIIVKTPTGYRHSYVHFDGDMVGAALRKAVVNDVEAEALMDLGEARCIEDTLDASEFFHRNKGERLKQHRSAKVEYDWVADFEYVYVWDGQWHDAKRGFRDSVKMPEGF